MQPHPQWTHHHHPGQGQGPARLFDEIAPLCAERKGGYTRIVKLGQRLTDSALVAMIEIIDLPREAAEKEEAPATTEATA